MRAFLEEKRFGVLATINPSGTAQLTVMWYLLEGDDILFNTKRGRQKELNLSRDPRVSFVVEDGYRFVRITGRVTLVAVAETGHRDIHRLAIRYQGEDSAAKAMERFSREERLSYRIAVANVYASGF